MSADQKADGFTLIEVMLAMTLLSIMVVLLFGSLKISADSWNKGEKKIAEVNEKAVVYQFFKRHLPSIRPLWDDFSDDDRNFSFQGGRDNLRFVSVFPASAGRKGLQIFEISFDKIETGLIKVALKPFFITEDSEQGEPDEVILLENVEEFKLSYLEKEEGDDKGFWVDSWEQKETMPTLIKIKIALVDGSYWPEMIFALKLGSIEAGPNLSSGLKLQ